MYSILTSSLILNLNYWQLCADFMRKPPPSVEVSLTQVLCCSVTFLVDFLFFKLKMNRFCNKRYVKITNKLLIRNNLVCYSKEFQNSQNYFRYTHMRAIVKLLYVQYISLFEFFFHFP